MTDSGKMQKIQLQLLSEFDQLCQNHDVSYFVLGKTALEVRLGMPNPLNRPVIEVGMRAADFSTLIQAMAGSQLPADRGLDCWLTNPYYDSYSAKYVDTNSLYLDLTRSYKNQLCGMYLRINILREGAARGFRKTLSRICSLHELGWEMLSSQGRVSGSRKARLCGDVVEKQLRVFGRKAVAKQLFHQFSKAFDYPAAPRSFIRAFKTRRRWYEREWFANPLTATVEGVDFPIPSDNEYYASIYGSAWQEREYSGWQPASRTLVDPDMPYADFLKVLESSGHSYDGYLEQREKTHAKRLAIQPKVNKIYRYWNLLYRTADRFLMWEMFYPHKEEILREYQAGNYEEVSAVLTPYRRQIRKNMGKHLGLSFDPELLDVQLDLYRREGKERYAAAVQAAIPDSHKKPIVILSYDGRPLSDPPMNKGEHESLFVALRERRALQDEQLP